jgi:proteasome activator subunit 4
VISEVERLVVQTIDVDAGFALIDPSDQRHRLAYSQRLRLGRVLHGAALALKQGHEGEDHIDAVMSVVKGIDTYLLDYALNRGDFDNLQKSYATARELVTRASRSRDVFNVLPTDSIEHGLGRKRIHVLSISNVLSSITVDEYTCMPYTDDGPSSTTTLSKIS